MVNLLLSVTFACGVAIAGLHVVNRRFIAPMYDVVLNQAAFLAAVASSVLLGHVLPAVFAALAPEGAEDAKSKMGLASLLIMM